MNSKDYVIRACQMLKVDLIKPARGNPGIVGTHWVNKFGHSVIDAQTWDEAKTQLEAWRLKRVK